ncbi:MAG: hypothetical protein AAGF66_19060 [Cyanobacteria bacterium P01_H01_bin.119]
MLRQLRDLKTLLYLHGNPKAANMQQGWFYDFSNYPMDAIEAVAKEFVLANCFNPDIAVTQFTDTT